MRINKTVMSTLVLASFCGFSVVNNVSATSSKDSSAESTKTDGVNTLEKNLPVRAEHKGVIFTLVACLIVPIVYKILPKALRRNVVSFFRKAFSKSCVTSEMTLAKRDQTQQDGIPSLVREVVTPGPGMQGQPILPTEVSTCEVSTEVSNLKKLNICDLAKNEKYKEGILKAIYAYLFLTNVENRCMNVDFLLTALEKKLKSNCLKFFKDLEKNKKLSKFLLEDRDIDYGGELGKYLVNVESITQEGKQDIARFLLDNLDNFSGFGKSTVYNMYWGRWYPDDIVFDSFVKDLNFNSEPAANSSM